MGDVVVLGCVVGRTDSFEHDVSSSSGVRSALVPTKSAARVGSAVTFRIA